MGSISKNGISVPKQKKWTSSLNSTYSNYSVFLLKNRKVNITIQFSIRISLNTKFQLKQTIINFWTKFAQKRNFHPKTEKVNITVKFETSE